MKLIDKDALVAEIERRYKLVDKYETNEFCAVASREELVHLMNFIDTLEVREVNLDIEKRIKECPFRQVACNRYEDTPVECDGRCSWVVDYPKLKELKAQKGE